jgi:hypothetical protein
MTGGAREAKEKIFECLSDLSEKEIDLSQSSEPVGHKRIHDHLSEMIDDAGDQRQRIEAFEITAPYQVGDGQGLLRGVKGERRGGRPVESDSFGNSIIHR